MQTTTTLPCFETNSFGGQRRDIDYFLDIHTGKVAEVLSDLTLEDEEVDTYIGKTKSEAYEVFESILDGKLSKEDIDCCVREFLARVDTMVNFWE